MNDSGRVEAFSDGVFAIAITLLILEIKVPQNAGGDFWHALGAQWPSYAAYMVTFLVIGIIWVNHHTMFGFIARVDRVLLFLNLLLLMSIAALPWPAALMAAYLRSGSAAHSAAVVYSSFMVYTGLLIHLIWRYMTRTGHLFRDDIDVEAARATRSRYALGLLIYPLTVGLAFVSAPLTLAVHGVLALYYSFNQMALPTREKA